VFYQVVDEIPHLTRLTLQGLGEPLLSPYLPEMIRTAVQRKIIVWIQHQRHVAYRPSRR
jgi:wyosine [tRNA(Phe)-imidazoG37] synthetase (radical SAM superfamily)